jgi:protein involved in polysaccharide export with SLBB domain
VLGEKYLRNPQVAINVATPAQKLVSVEGQVNRAGAYPVQSNTTLLGAISMASSPTRIAKLDETILFRTVNGQRMARALTSIVSARGWTPTRRSLAAMWSWSASRRPSRPIAT